MSPEPGAGDGPPPRIRLLLPEELRPLNDGWPAVTLTGHTLGEALAGLGTTRPALHDRLLTERGRLRPHLHVFVAGREVRRTGGLETPLDDGDEAVLLRAVSGG